MLPLNGIRVLELGQNLAGPYGAEILATLGADVVKIERPAGDDVRYWGQGTTAEASYTFHAMNYNKRGVALDLDDPAAVAWLRQYAADCDVVVQNMRAGVVEKLGLDAKTLRAANPRLIYCSISAFGHAGPLKSKPGYEPIVQAFSGIFSVNGAPDTPPTRVGIPILDLGTGMWTAIGCLAALYRRQFSGEGCVVDASLFETALGWLTLGLGNYMASGTVPVRHRTGSPRIVVFQAFDTSDGEIVVAAANDRLFGKLAVALERPRWAADPRFRDNGQRLKHKDDLIPEIEKILRSKSTAEWTEIFEAGGVPCGSINTMAEVVASPQTKAVGMLQTAPDFDKELVGIPLSFDTVRPSIHRAAPRIGQHTDEIMPPRAKVHER
jgi:crotonobetainyl-CoA:carnitine CoA-transferase CaiB-like acyl-CoA transferase